MHNFQYSAYNYPAAYNSRVPFYIPRPFVDDYFTKNKYFEKVQHTYVDKDEKQEKPLFLMKFFAFAQIFSGGVLLVSDLSKIVLLWNFLTLSDVKLEYVCQLMYPIFVVVLGFVSLSATLCPSAATSKFLLALIVCTIVPTIILPRYATFITAAMEAMALARAAEHSFQLLQEEEVSASLVHSEAANRLLRMLAAHNERWPLGIKELSQLSPDYTLAVQYILVTYAMFSFVHLLILIMTAVVILRLLRLQTA